MVFRSLTGDEISLLRSQGCYSSEWSDISVKEGFSADNIWHTRFEGKISLGVFPGTGDKKNGQTGKSGIYNSNISNCVISDNVYISEVKNLKNYHVEENAILENTGTIVTESVTSFGNGTEIDVLNEGGGRTLPIYDRLSSQVAYMAVVYRHDSEFTEKLLGMIHDYCSSRRSDHGVIGCCATVRDTRIIRNVSVGEYSVINGATLLEEGTISSCMEAPVYVGEGVIAKKFIILSGSKVDSGALIDKSFVGQSVKMGKQYSAENSVFFANSEAFHGEGCSIFAGPYTVTHHKSTLMIASLFSFFNAGSGTNQSNHMYKLGPVHQGILERGAKTGSFAYLLLPARVGAFSVIMGKHYSNFDSSDFPFSYITEEKGKSELTPAMNIFTVGTRRDSEKWGSRDKRTDPEKLDLIHFDLFNPYIVGRIVNGINILNEFAEKTPKTQDYINYKGNNIHRLLLKTSRKYYDMAVKIYIGQEVVKRLEGISDPSSPDEIRSRLETSGKEGTGTWVEICGLFSPSGRIEDLMHSVRSGKTVSLQQLNAGLKEIYDRYDEYAWQWCAGLIGSLYGSEPASLPAERLVQIIEDWKQNAMKFNNMILKDAEKEFDSGARLGFGIDGDMNTRDLDFHAVRGEYKDNKFVQGLEKETAEIAEKADKLISLLRRHQ